MRAPHGPPSRLVVPGAAAGDAHSPGNPSRSFGRAAAVFDLITSSTSGRLTRSDCRSAAPARPAARTPRSLRDAPPCRTSHRGRVGMRISLQLPFKGRY